MYYMIVQTSVLKILQTALSICTCILIFVSSKVFNQKFQTCLSAAQQDTQTFCTARHQIPNKRKLTINYHDNFYFNLIYYGILLTHFLSFVCYIFKKSISLICRVSPTLSTTGTPGQETPRG